VRCRARESGPIRLTRGVAQLWKKDKNPMANKQIKIEGFQKMLDPADWPVQPGNMLLIDGEVWNFVTDDPLEERIYRPLFRKYQ
jgi:hypothetical protein